MAMRYYRSPQEVGAVSEADSSRRGITRRDMVQRLLRSAAAGSALPGIAAAHPVYKHLSMDAAEAPTGRQSNASNWAPAFLDPHQNETLVVLAEKLVPGSVQAQSNRFIDLALSAETSETQQKFSNALAAFEAESLNRYNRPFKDLSDTQQTELLTVASTAAPAKAEGRKGTDWIAKATPASNEPAPATLRDHFEYLKGWVSGAYYSSEIGMKELGWTGDHYFESFPGCPHSEEHH
jgi:gluconate 2-dehydrogenase subunit 3-like protein